MGMWGSTCQIAAGPIASCPRRDAGAVDTAPTSVRARDTGARRDAGATGHHLPDRGQQSSPSAYVATLSRLARTARNLPLARETHETGYTGGDGHNPTAPIAWLARRQQRFKGKVGSTNSRIDPLQQVLLTFDVNENRFVLCGKRLDVEFETHVAVLGR